VNRVLHAAVLAGAFSGVPSTAWAVARGEDPLAATRAAGRMLRPGASAGPRVLAAAAIVHAALSLGWTAVLAAVLPRRRTVLAGALAGAGIGALDLGFARAWRHHPRLSAVAALPAGPQLADHVAFGALAGAALRPVRPPRR
jgi:hypothetical protein